MKKILISIGIMLLFQLSGITQNLEELTTFGLEHSPGLKASYAKFEAGMKRAARAKGMPDPVFSAGYFISPVETRVGPQRAKLSLSQMFPWFGTLKAKEEAVALQAEADYQLYLDAQNELFYKIKSLYYKLIEQNEKQTLLQTQKEVLQFFKETITSQFSNGKAKMADVLRVDILLEDIETEIQLNEQKERPLSVQLRRIINWPDSLPLTVKDTFQLEEINYTQVTDSLTAHPKLEYFATKKRAWAAEEKAAEKQGMPSVGLGLDYVFVGQRNDMNVPENGKNAFMPMVSVSLPIYRGKYKASREEAVLNQEATEYGRQEMMNQLQSGIEMARFELEEKKLKLKLYQQQSEKLKRSYRLLLTEYSNSNNSFEGLLRVQKELLNYQIKEIESRYAYSIALAKLQYLSGNR